MADQLRDLRRLARQVEGTVVVCSGELPMEAVPSHQITIRYDQATTNSKISLPSPSAVEIDALIKAAKPTTFGKDDKDVLDTTYRDAVAMDADQFTSSFRLSEYPQLVSEIKTILAPDDALLLLPRLYKLNVYGPGGFFKAHRDTPRGDANMFGTLVVCLPVAFTGGAFVVKSDDGPTTTLDWGTKSSDTLQWCAFYSDTEHEVLPVRSGHRITLTYLLEQVPAAVPTLSIRAHAFSTLEMKLREALANPNFAPHGVQLGFGLKHAYVADKMGTVPMLKGADRVLKDMLESLGLKYAFVPVYAIDEYDADALMDFQDGFERLGDESEADEDDGKESSGDDDDHMNGLRPPTMGHFDDEPYNLLDFTVPGVPRDSMCTSKNVWGGDTAPSLFAGTWQAYHEEIGQEADRDNWNSLDFAGLALSKTRRVVWLAPPTSFPLLKSGIAYGNQASLESYYAAASFIVWVPSTKDRATTQTVQP